MSVGLKKSELEALSAVRLKEAQLLFANNHFSGAYYLAGYVIEFALKAILAARFVTNTIPPKDFVNKIYTHKPHELVKQAGLQTDLKSAQDADPNFQAYWAVVAEWDPEVRYTTTPQMKAQLMLEAVSHPQHGVFQWIRTFW